MDFGGLFLHAIVHNIFLVSFNLKLIFLQPWVPGIPARQHSQVLALSTVCTGLQECSLVQDPISSDFKQ